MNTKTIALSLALVCSVAQPVAAQSNLVRAIRANPTLRAIVGLGGLCLMFGVGEATREADSATANSGTTRTRGQFSFGQQEGVSDFAKALTAGAMLTWYEILMGEGQGADLAQNLIKVGLVAATNYTANTEVAGDWVRAIPGIGGLLSDRKENGKERPGFGRLARCVATYMALRGAAQIGGFIS